MASLRRTSCLVVIFATFALCFASDCQLPPKFWCENKEIAKLCGVYNDCKEKFMYRNSSSDAVHVAVYFESYCPDSIHFITQVLYPTWAKLKDTNVMKVTLFPYGKATSTENPDGTFQFTCQHGERECTGNILENCVIKYTDEVANDYIPVINCLELASDPVSAEGKCIKKFGLDVTSVYQCTDSMEGNKLMYEAGVATQALKPALNWVPWIVVNGIHNDSIQSQATKNLLQLVCMTYKGANVPVQCRDLEY